MLIYAAVLLSVGTYYVLQKARMGKFIGFTLLGYGTNLFLISCIAKKSILIQSLILTAIVIGMSMLILLLRSK